MDARPLCERAQRGVAFSQPHAPGDDVLVDAVGLAELGQVVVAGRDPEHAGGVAVARGPRRIAEGQQDRKSKRLNSSHQCAPRMQSSACKNITTEPNYAGIDAATKT